MSTPWASRRRSIRPCPSASRGRTGRSAARSKTVATSTTPTPGPGSSCAIFNPGGSGPAASGAIPTCDTSVNPTDPNAGQCGLPGVPVGDAKRIFRGIELTARKAFSQTFWAQASYLYSTLRGNYSGRDPRGLRPDGPRHQRRLRLQPVPDQRLRQPRARPAPPVPDGRGLQRALRPSVGGAVLREDGVPTSRRATTTLLSGPLFLDTRGSDGRLPTDYETNLSLSYNFNVGPVTVTPQLYIFNVFNRQTVTGLDERYNIYGSTTSRPGEPVLRPGRHRAREDRPGQHDHCPATATAPCSDNADYRKATSRVGPALLRAALEDLVLSVLQGSIRGGFGRPFFLSCDRSYPEI